MTRQDYQLIANCIVECHNKNYDLEDTIRHFNYMLDMVNRNFDPSQFKTWILERTKPDHIPKEQAKKWATKKSRKQ